MSAKQRGVAAGSGAPASAAPAGAWRERARGRGAGQGQPREARGARAVGVAPWVRTSAAPGFAEEKGRLSVLSAPSQFRLGSAVSQSPDMFGGEGTRGGAECGERGGGFWPGSRGVSFAALLPDTVPPSFGENDSEERRGAGSGARILL